MGYLGKEGAKAMYLLLGSSKRHLIGRINYEVLVPCRVQCEVIVDISCLDRSVWEDRSQLSKHCRLQLFAGVWLPSLNVCRVKVRIRCLQLFFVVRRCLSFNLLGHSRSIEVQSLQLRSDVDNLAQGKRLKMARVLRTHCGKVGLG